MNEREISEIRRRFKPDKCNISQVRGCYVNDKGEILTQFTQSVNLMLEKLGASPEEAVMLGDTKFDIGCANNAGVDSILVGWSHYVDEESMAADGFEPTWRLSEPALLLELV